MRNAFSLAVSPPDGRCLKLRLRPLTLGHLFILHKIDSPIVSSGQCLLGDLAIGALICSEDWQSSERNMRRWWTPLFLVVWGWLNRKADVEAEAEAFREYLSESNRSPAHKLPKGDRIQRIECPSHWYLLSFLMGELGMSQDEAKSMTVIESNALIAATLERTGKLELLGEEFEGFMAACARMDREFEEQRKN